MNHHPYMYKRLVDVFRKIDVRYEIIFVNDCSPDHAREVLTEIANKIGGGVINHTAISVPRTPSPAA